MGFFDLFKSKSININRTFPKDECTTLVIYAGHSFDENPDDSFPSFIPDNFNPNDSAFVSDIAPYLTVLEAREMLTEIRNWKDKAKNKLDYSIAYDAEKWVKKKISKKCTHFMYELEPKAAAGNAFNWAFFQERNN